MSLTDEQREGISNLRDALKRNDDAKNYLANAQTDAQLEDAYTGYSLSRDNLARSFDALDALDAPESLQRERDARAEAGLDDAPQTAQAAPDAPAESPAGEPMSSDPDGAPTDPTAPGNGDPAGTPAADPAPAA